MTKICEKASDFEHNTIEVNGENIKKDKCFLSKMNTQNVLEFCDMVNGSKMAAVENILELCVMDGSSMLLMFIRWMSVKILKAKKV